VGWFSDLEYVWKEPHLRRMYERLPLSARLILLDQRGTGLSDRVPDTDLPDLETRMDDVRAVLDAAGSEHAAMFAFGGGAPMAILVAASITPGSAVAEFGRYLASDVRRILPTIQVPTLVLSQDPNEAEPERSLYLTNPENGRYLASHIPGARLTEIVTPAGQIHHLHWYGRSEPILREVDRFLADLRDEQASFDRILATVLFTDIIGSTAKAAELGDHAWSGLLERHHSTVRALLARYRGHEVDTAGDGFFVTFDGPARAVRCATAIADAVRSLGIEVRAGVHTGEVETIDGKVAGMAVNVGARVGAAAAAGEVLVSQTVKDLTAGSGLVLEDAGEHELKGVPDRWRLYRVVGG